MRTIGRFVYFIERNIGKAKQSEKEFLEGLDEIQFSSLKSTKLRQWKLNSFLWAALKLLGQQRDTVAQ